MSQSKQNNLDPILLKLRKLREALISTSRIDDFAIRVYESSVDVSLSVNNIQELSKSLIRLSIEMYPDHSSKRRAEMESYHLLFRMFDTDIMKMYTALPGDVKDSDWVYRSIRIFLAVRRDLDYVSLVQLWNECTLNQKLILEVEFY